MKDGNVMGKYAPELEKFELSSVKAPFDFKYLFPWLWFLVICVLVTASIRSFG